MEKRIPIPCGETILCKKLKEEEELPENDSFYIKKETLDVFQIEDFGEKIDGEKYPFKIGDKILVSSTGSDFELDEIKWVLFEPKDVIGKIV